MLTIHSLRASTRRAGLAPLLFGAMVLAACGSSTTGTSSGAAAATPTPTAPPTSTPGPSSVQATLTGDPAVTGALVMGNVHFVTCQYPTLKGPSILAFRTATDMAIGVLLTLRQGSISVRLAEGSGTAYTERTFDGTGVTAFDAASGATFSSSLTESTPAGDHKGTLGAISSIAGSVSCGTSQAGSASITVAGNSAGGAVTGSPTQVRVACGSSAPGQNFATVTGLIQVGSTPAVVSISGGSQQSPLYVFLQTASATYSYTGSTAGSVTVTTSNATYNATVTETAPVAGAHTLMVSGNATCGVSS
jgi:hypothetical protein